MGSRLCTSSKSCSAECVEILLWRRTCRKSRNHAIIGLRTTKGETREATLTTSQAPGATSTGTGVVVGNRVKWSSRGPLAPPPPQARCIPWFRDSMVFATRVIGMAVVHRAVFRLRNTICCRAHKLPYTRTGGHTLWSTYTGACTRHDARNTT